MALNNFQWSTKRDQPKRVGGNLDVDALTLLSAKVDVMTKRLDRMNIKAVNSSATSPCESYGSIEQVTLNCQVRSSFSKTLVRLTMFKISTQGRRMILTLVPVIRVGRII